jgi:hypothetical protein
MHERPLIYNDKCATIHRQATPGHLGPLSGGLGVAGSNPVAPTNRTPIMTGMLASCAGSVYGALAPAREVTYAAVPGNSLVSRA